MISCLFLLWSCPSDSQLPVSFKLHFLIYKCFSLSQASMISSLFVSGLACLIASCLPDSLTALQTAFFLIGRTGLFSVCRCLLVGVRG